MQMLLTVIEQSCLLFYHAYKVLTFEMILSTNFEQHLLAFDFKKGFHVKDLSKYLKYLPATLDCTSSLHTHHQSKCQTNKKDLLA